MARSPATVPGPIASFDARWPLDLPSWPGLEAQIAALADDIAYVNHDIDDGLRAGHCSKSSDLAARAAGGRACPRRCMARYGELELSPLHRRIDPYPDECADWTMSVRRPARGWPRPIRGSPPTSARRRRRLAGFSHAMLERGAGAQTLPLRPHVPPSARHRPDGRGPRRS